MHGDAERLGQPAQSVKPFAGQGIGPVHRTEVDVQGRGDQARAAAEPLQRRLGVVARLRRPQVLSILDKGQLELVEFQLGDLSKGRLQRLPREAERATGDEHPSLLFRTPGRDRPGSCFPSSAEGRQPLGRGKGLGRNRSSERPSGTRPADRDLT